MVVGVLMVVVSVILDGQGKNVEYLNVHWVAILKEDIVILPINVYAITTGMEPIAAYLCVLSIVVQ
jgi:hypothetical protein